MKKGFLSAKGTRKAGATGSGPPAVELQEEEVSFPVIPSGAPYGGLQPELLILVIEQLVEQGGARVQQDIVSLRKTSKLLCKIATRYFYRTIQLTSAYRIMSLIRQLQANPKLCDSTRAVFWDEMQNGLPAVESSKPYLCRFVNLEEVALVYNVDIPESRIGCPMGIHFALRDVGPWCEPAPFKRPADVVQRLQCTPTLRVAYMVPENQLAGLNLAEDEEDERETKKMEQKWKQSRDGKKAAKFVPVKLDKPKKERAIWACHMVLPTLLRAAESFWTSAGATITHLTIDLYDHPRLTDTNLDEVLADILNPRIMPMLEHLTIRLLDVGKRPNGLPTREDVTVNNPYPGMGERDREPTLADGFDVAAIAREDEVEWANRVQEVKSALDRFNDPRTRFAIIRYANATRQRTRFLDVRKHTLKQWQERVYHGRAGPWRDPMTQKVKDGIEMASDEVVTEPLQPTPGEPEHYYFT